MVLAYQLTYRLHVYAGPTRTTVSLTACQLEPLLFTCIICAFHNVASLVHRTQVYNLCPQNSGVADSPYVHNIMYPATVRLFFGTGIPTVFFFFSFSELRSNSPFSVSMHLTTGRSVCDLNNRPVDFLGKSEITQVKGTNIPPKGVSGGFQP